MKKMLAKIAETLYDVTAVKTGALTAKNGFTLSEVGVRQVGRVVHIKGFATKSGGIGTDEITFAQISGVSVPLSMIRYTVACGNAAYNAEHSAYGIVNTAGELRVRTISHGTATAIIFCITYLV